MNTDKLFGPVNPGTTSRLSQGHLDVNQSRKLLFTCLFSPGMLPGAPKTRTRERGYKKPNDGTKNRNEGHSLKPPFEKTALLKDLLMPLFLMGCFPVDFQEVKRPLRTKSSKRPIKVGKRPIKEGKRPIKAMVLVGVSVGCLMGCFRAPPPWRKTAPLKRPIKRSMTVCFLSQHS